MFTTFDQHFCVACLNLSAVISHPPQFKLYSFNLIIKSSLFKLLLLVVVVLLSLQVIPVKANYNYFTLYKASSLNLKLGISNGNRTEWSPIQSVIILVINKIGRPRRGSPICLITSMITDRIGRHEVLLPINHNFNKICDIIGYFLNQNTRNSKLLFC